MACGGCFPERSVLMKFIRIGHFILESLCCHHRLVLLGRELRQLSNEPHQAPYLFRAMGRTDLRHAVMRIPCSIIP